MLYLRDSCSTKKKGKKGGGQSQFEALLIFHTNRQRKLTLNFTQLDTLERLASLRDPRLTRQVSLHSSTEVHPPQRIFTCPPLAHLQTTSEALSQLLLARVDARNKGRMSGQTTRFFEQAVGGGGEPSLLEGEGEDAGGVGEFEERKDVRGGGRGGEGGGSGREQAGEEVGVHKGASSGEALLCVDN